MSQPPSTPAGAAVPSGVVVPPNTPAGGLLSQTQSQAQVAQTPAPKEKKKRKQKGKASDAVPSATVTATPVSGAIGKLTVKDGAATRSLGDNVNAVGSPILDRKGTKAPQSETNPALGEGIIADDGNDRSLDAPVEVKTKKGRRKKEKKGKPVPAEGVASDALVEVPPEEKQSGATSEKEKKEEMGGDGKVVKKRKRSKKVDGQEDGLGSVPVSVAAPSIVTKSASGPTPEEVKQKRSSTGVEKKKAKIAKGKRGGETVKESLVGKKGL